MNKIYMCDKIKYVAPIDNEYRFIYLVKVDEFDKAWESGPQTYIPPGKGDIVKNARIKEYIFSNSPIIIPEVKVVDFEMFFIDGRHRFVAIRDMCKKVTMVRCSQELNPNWSKKIAPKIGAI